MTPRSETDRYEVKCEPDSLLAFIKQRGNHVTFAELIHYVPGAAGNRELLAGSEDSNIVIWSGVSQALVDALHVLLGRGDIHYQPTAPLTYLIDGTMLKLPIAKRPRKYKKPHWCPVALVLGSVK